MSEQRDTRDDLADSESETQDSKPQGNGKKGLQIGLWGTVGSGKTTYIAMLHQYITQHSGFRIIPRNAEAKTLIRDSHRRIKRECLFPQRTRPDPTHIKTYKFQIFRDIQERTRTGLFSSSTSERTKSVMLSFTDAGGDWYRDPDSMRATFAEYYTDRDEDDPIELLAKSDGIVCLLDTLIAMGQRFEPIGPGESEIADLAALSRDEFFEDLMNLFYHMGDELDVDERGYLKQAFVFCLSKIDMVATWPQRNQPQELARVILPQDVLATIANYCHPSRTHWCCISSIGTVENSKGEEISGCDENNLIRDPNRLKPFNLIEPIGWLVSCISGDHTWRVG